MANRIENKFKELRAVKKKAFIPFITTGYPDLKVTEDLLLGLPEAGADVVELGVPFSDPLADGPTIQDASYHALERGVNLEKILALVTRVRKRTQVPIALMSYYNPIYHFGEKKFLAQVQKAGVDGLIIPDLPPEEAATLIKEARRHHVATVFFIAPTTTKQRMKRIVNKSSGFIYYVSVTGVTGARQSLPGNFVEKIKEVKTLTEKPICVGFGISTAKQVRLVSKVADGVIVGSAIMKQLMTFNEKKDQVAKTLQFCRSLAKGVRSSGK
ncbi:MAG: tryptophan synthase subunit alpha [Candidatus Omnitrophica bacterium]|nr:tryptophan synthase subunit alpha [Candidatus Omnitrophota bacterium]